MFAMKMALNVQQWEKVQVRKAQTTALRKNLFDWDFDFALLAHLQGRR